MNSSRYSIDDRSAVRLLCVVVVQRTVLHIIPGFCTDNKGKAIERGEEERGKGRGKGRLLERVFPLCFGGAAVGGVESWRRCGVADRSVELPTD